MKIGDGSTYLLHFVQEVKHFSAINYAGAAM